ncbi:hypothetical protein BJI67_04770 [Acidihalobacter aeolianus]|uniref:Molybdopterin molybdenumtransferase n=1 Tax=Acidihalobacter aeolianus TaxID=2792603 RepID=A0A1D8K6B8_9GAMM|nr:gephyrin-like molybdotransferase Glp [Acidihalobacter aeolianus]AOV16476.1 hypothetical protein BJI67_04770 [Acidihalobacter aeolianus]
MNALPARPSGRNAPTGDLPFAQALQRMLDAVRPLDAVERVSLRAASGRILAADAASPYDVPPHDNAAMDGYALRAADLPAETERRIALHLTGQVLAGPVGGATVAPGECIRITTGAAMPPGADTVVMQEEVEVGDGRIVVSGGHVVGENIRRAGEDLARGAVVLARGRRLLPADIGLLAAIGLTETDVVRRPRVALLSTGDELRGLGERLRAGEIHDSNRYALLAALGRLGVDAHDLGTVEDRPEALRAVLAEAAAGYDAVVSSGGVSAGDADHTRGVLAELGEVDFWRVAIRPGRPLAFGRLGGALFFGLPGNPVAALVIFYQLVLPTLERLSGTEPRVRRRQRARALAAMRKSPGRTEFQRGVLSTADDGSLCVALTGAQGSGLLHSMSRADCFVVLDEARGPVEAGEWVTVEPFADFV